MPFAVGDRVVAVGKVDGLDMTGKRGRVVVVMPEGTTTLRIGVQFDQPFPSGHNCSTREFGSFKDGYCRWGREREFRHLDDPLHMRIAPTRKPKHVFRPGDRVRFYSEAERMFITRDSLPIGAAGTVFWVGRREGHYPHIIILLDEKDSKTPIGRYGAAHERVEFSYYGIDIENMPPSLQRRWHSSSPGSWKYLGKRINPDKLL